MKNYEKIYLENYTLINQIFGIEKYSKEEGKKNILELLKDYNHINDEEEKIDTVINNIIENNSIYYNDIYNINNTINLFIKDYESIVEDAYNEIRENEEPFYKVLTYINSRVIFQLFYDYINAILDNSDYKGE